MLRARHEANSGITLDIWRQTQLIQMFKLLSTSSMLFWLLLLSPQLWAQKRQNVEKHTLSGFVYDAKSKESLIGTALYLPALKTGTTTNGFGFFSITVPADTITVIVSYVGYYSQAILVDLRNKDVSLEIKLQTADKLLGEVVVVADALEKKESDRVEMSVINIPIQQIKDIPALLGEKDVLKVIQLLPGVQKGGEGNAGLYVRGGGPDQNLIILDDATVYNAFHLFGFFSLFNGDALKSVDLTKGGFPSRYGGRLSSVIDMRMKDGNKETFSGEAGIGAISSRATFEGPIIKNKSSFLVSARRTYVDALIRPFIPGDDDGGYYFYDLNAKVNYQLNPKNTLYLSGYFGRDRFFLQQAGADRFEAGVNWGNGTGTLRWNHLINNQTFGNASLIFTDYTFRNYINFNFASEKFSLVYTSGVQDISLKYDIDYRPSTRHSIRMGTLLTRHVFTPSAVVLIDDFASTDTTTKDQVVAYENALYIEDDIRVNDRFTMQPGLRLTHFAPRNANYINLEPRFSANYKLSSDLSVKASYALMNQYIHLLSNTGAGLPTDLWVPATQKLTPQRSQQVAMGVAYDMPKQQLLLTVEGYYKRMDNVIAYKEGSSFLAVDGGNDANDLFSWEKVVTPGRGWSYGAEFFLQKKKGDFTGWVGYTLSWTQLQFDELNDGKAFWARYDRRHDISIVGTYALREVTPDKNGITLSATWVYGTGNAITLPVAEQYAPIHDPAQGGNDVFDFFNQNYVSQYTGRNQFRMAAYHRLDLGMQITKKMKWYTRTIEISVYNAYNRKNPYFYFIGNAGSNSLFPGTGQQRTLKQITLFPIIPSVSYNIKF